MDNPNSKIKSYYDSPTQVQFLDFDYILNANETEEDRPHIAGIAYYDFIICSDCGFVFNITDLKEQAQDLQFKELPWISFQEAIEEC